MDSFLEKESQRNARQKSRQEAQLNTSNAKIKVAIVATHPVQYQVPWFQALARHSQLQLKVYFALLPSREQQGVGFNVPFAWDIPMLEDYEWQALPNTGKRPGLTGFFSNSTPSIRSVLSIDRPDVVIISGWHALPMLQVLWACMMLRIPRIVRGESNALHPRRSWIRLLHRMLVTRYHAYLAIGKANREFYLGYGVEPGRIFPCRYFVDNQCLRTRFESTLPDRSELRAKWCIPESVFCFLYVGKLQSKKRILDLLQALRGAMQSRGDLHLLIVGTGELDQPARALVAEAKLPVSFAGFLNQTELPQAYAVGDCLVLPSDYGETWGLVVNEAMVCGLPAIVSDRVGCGPDLVEPGVTGEVFPYGNVLALSDRLCTLAADRGRAVALGRHAEERIRDYSVEHAVAGTLQAIDFVLARV